jgi:hypothetical protein
MSSSNLLLLGAGFSYNWDAPLAKEVADFLLQTVGGDPHLQALLKQDENNFENALSEVQRDYISSPSTPQTKERLDRLQDAIGTMFDRLNVTFERRTDFEFCNDLHFSITRFLTHFDAIFSLNQDLLLELRYEPNILSASNARWGGLQMPGMRPVPDPSLTGIGDKHRRRWTTSPGPFTIEPRIQPYFKLHGSSNWYTSDGRQLLVMGGNKDTVIREHEVLRWYYDEFKRRLMTGSTKLMVIGYSFSDRHINEAITDAWQKGTLAGIFLVDPSGRYVLNPTPPYHIKVPNTLEEIRHLGGSTRPIRATFAGDAFEHEKFVDFFRDDNKS